MELFKITCVTCKAALSVRNESIIGSIIACPRCGSMVEVAQPAAPEEGQAQPTADADSPVEAPLPDLPASSNFLTWAMCTLAAGLTIIASLTWWFTSGVDPQSAKAVAEVVRSANEPEQPLVNESDTKVEPEVASNVEEQMAEVAEPATEPIAPEPITEVSLAPDPPVVVDEAVEEPQEEPSREEVERVAAAPSPSPHVFNALDLDPESIELGSLGTAKKEPQPAVIEVPPHSQHSNVMEPEISTVPVARRGLAPESGASTRLSQEQFQLQLPSLEVRDMPLLKFLQLLSQISGVPVSVSAEQLHMAGISPRKRISLEAHEVTLDTALKQVLEPLQMEHHYNGAKVIVTRQAADKLRTVTYPVDDLVASNTQSEQLRRWIEQLVEPSSWDSASIEIVDRELEVEQTQGVHYQLLTFLERLRMVRSLKTRSRFPVSRLAPTPLHAAMAPRLSRSALFTFTQETPLAEIVLHWQRELEVPFLVDWPALAELDLWPDTPVVCAIADTNWQEALSAVLQPLGLQWRVCIGGGIEISSASEYHLDRQLELYPLASRANDDGVELLAQLRQHLSEQLSGHADSALIEVVYDPQGPAVIALLNATAQRDTLQWLVDHELFAPR